MSKTRETAITVMDGTAVAFETIAKLDGSDPIRVAAYRGVAGILRTITHTMKARGMSVEQAQAAFARMAKDPTAKVDTSMDEAFDRFADTLPSDEPEE